MAFWTLIALGLAAAYLLGSVPTGYLAGRLLKGIDIREYGSKSTGATNVLRTLGSWPFAVVLSLDVLKGAMSVILVREVVAWTYARQSITPPSGADLTTLTSWTICLAGLAALVGHARPVWLRFNGGKSVAAGLGVLLAMSWPVGLGGLAVFGLTLALFRIMSLGSMAAAVTAIVLVCALEHPLPYRLFVIVGGLFVIVRHHANIRRLLAGTEPSVGQSAAPDSR
ncbi:MAG: glycerol-3-phosphate acyltransferase [Phenylobacterium sp.]|nr:glycerol-3-phosphate 1-O-acyltransferase PlsY [Phenylobacterium sp.]MBC7167450.1 glycerol-3-phosphate acyltransferase [Phenylobacterium sp.]